MYLLHVGTQALLTLPYYAQDSLLRSMGRPACHPPRLKILQEFDKRIQNTTYNLLKTRRALWNMSCFFPSTDTFTSDYLWRQGTTHQTEKDPIMITLVSSCKAMLKGEQVVYILFPVIHSKIGHTWNAPYNIFHSIIYIYIYTGSTKKMYTHFNERKLYVV